VDIMLLHVNPTNSIFTSVGRRVELLRAFRKAYKTLALDGHIVATDIDPLAPALQVVDRPYIVPRLDDPAYIPTLVDICEREAISLVFPLIDPDIPVLSSHRDILEQTGARLAVIAPEATQTITDKWLTTQFFQSLGIPSPRSWLPETFQADQVEYPLIIKPRQGSAGKNIFKVTNEKEVLSFLPHIPDPIIQEYLPDSEITNDVICDLDGNVLAIVSRERLEVRWGEVAKGRTIYNPAIVQACERIAHALPAIGPITVQCIMKRGVPHFTEINARFGGGVPLGIAAGADSPQWLLARTAGIQIEIPPLGTYQTGLYLTRFDDSYFLSQEDYENMARRRL
jgi:carbamoyl-phosphate synthase large subunit